MRTISNGWTMWQKGDTCVADRDHYVVGTLTVVGPTMVTVRGEDGKSRRYLHDEFFSHNEGGHSMVQWCRDQAAYVAKWEREEMGA